MILFLFLGINGMGDVRKVKVSGSMTDFLFVVMLLFCSFGYVIIKHEYPDVVKVFKKYRFCIHSS